MISIVVIYRYNRLLSIVVIYIYEIPIYIYLLYIDMGIFHCCLTWHARFGCCEN